MMNRFLLLIGVLIVSQSAIATGTSSTQQSAGQSVVVKQNGLKAIIQPRESWINPVPLTEVPVASIEEAGSVEYLLYDRQIYMGTKPKYYTRFVQRAKTVSGLEEASTIEIGFNPAFQTLSLNSAEVIRDGKVIYQLDKEDIKLFSDEDELAQKMLTGRATALILLPGTRKGDLLSFEYTLEGQNPVFGEQQSGEFDLAWSVPLGLSKARLVVPNNKTIQLKDLGNSTIKPTITRSNLQTEYLWQQSNPKPIINEQYYPPSFIRYSLVEFSEYKDWNQVVKQQRPLYKDRALPIEVIQFVEKELKDLAPEEAVFRALNYVQSEIRYLGLEYGINAYQPHSPKEVWKKRLGDCKDKTLLLVSILDRLGIEAYPAIVNTSYRDGVNNSLPSPTVFNHVITYVKSEDQEWWIDPTSPPQFGGLDNISKPNFGYGLILKEGNNALKQMPTHSTEKNSIDNYELITVGDYSAPVRLETKTIYSGYAAESMRARLESKGKSTLNAEYIKFYTKLYGEVVSSKALEYTFDEKENKLVVKEEYYIKDFFSKTGKNDLKFDYTSTFLTDYFEYPKTKSRTSPFYVGAPIRVSQQLNIQFPEYFYTDANLSRYERKNDNFDYSFTGYTLPNGYIIENSLTIKNSVVKSEDVRKTIEDFSDSHDWLYRSYTITPSTGYLDKDVKAILEGSL